MPKFRAKPLVIEAMQFDGTETSFDAIRDWAKEPTPSGWFYSPESPVVAAAIVIPLNTGDLCARPSDWVVRGEGGIRVYTPEDFAATFEPETIGLDPAKAQPNCLVRLSALGKRELAELGAHGVEPYLDKVGTAIAMMEFGGGRFEFHVRWPDGEVLGYSARHLEEVPEPPKPTRVPGNGRPMSS